MAKDWTHDELIKQLEIENAKQADDMDRFREALKQICEIDWRFREDGQLSKVDGPCATIARAALKGDE